MSLSKPEDANYRPNLGHYLPLKPIRYWCQKVLPSIYNDSISYYEVLMKVVTHLNSAIGDVETAVDDIEKMFYAYTELEDYVNDTTDELYTAFNELEAYVNDSLSEIDSQTIKKPLSASAGQFLVYDGSEWIAQSLSTWQGGSY